MSPTTPQMRPTTPADRPPPRDPKAAGAPRDPDEPGFAAALKDSTALAVDRPTPAMLQEEGVSAAVAPQSAEQAETKTETGEPGKEAPTPNLVPSPAFAIPHLPLPVHPSESSPTGAQARAEGSDGKEAVHPILAAMQGTAARGLPAMDQTPTDRAGHTQHDATRFEASMADTRANGDSLLAAPPSSSPALRPVETGPPTPPPAPSLPTPPTPIVALPAAIAIRALDGTNRFDIRLDPEDLGRVDVALEIDGDGNIRAAIAAEKPEALQLIVREARALEQAFDQAGFRRDDNALSFSLSDRQSASQGQQDQPTRPPLTRFFVDGETEPLPPVLTTLLSVADGRLDVRI